MSVFQLIRQSHRGVACEKHSQRSVQNPLTANTFYHVGACTTTRELSLFRRTVKLISNASSFSGKSNSNPIDT